jgi:hypothetical protein
MTGDGNCHAIIATGADMGISLREALVRDPALVDDQVASNTFGTREGR